MVYQATSLRYSTRTVPYGNHRTYDSDDRSSLRERARFPERTLIWIVKKLERLRSIEGSLIRRLETEVERMQRESSQSRRDWERSSSSRSTHDGTDSRSSVSRDRRRRSTGPLHPYVRRRSAHRTAEEFGSDYYQNMQGSLIQYPAARTYVRGKRPSTSRSQRTSHAPRDRDASWDQSLADTPQIGVTGTSSAQPALIAPCHQGPDHAGGYSYPAPTRRSSPSDIGNVPSSLSNKMYDRYAGQSERDCPVTHRPRHTARGRGEDESQQPAVAKKSVRFAAATSARKHSPKRTGSWEPSDSPLLYSSNRSSRGNSRRR